MVFEAKYDNPVVKALHQYIVDERKASLSNLVFSETGAKMKIKGKSGELAIVFPCYGDSNPINLVSVERDGNTFTFEQNSKYPDHALKFVSERGFHETLKEISRALSRPGGDGPAFEVPDNVNGKFSYRAYFGEWNALPTGLLKQVSGFLFESSGAIVRWPPEYRSYHSTDLGDKTQLGVKHDTSGKHSKDYPAKREAFVRSLNEKRIIRIETVRVADGKSHPTQKEKLFLTNPDEIYKVMREIEDEVRKTGDNPKFHGGAGLSFSGTFNLADVLGIIPDVFDKRFERGELGCGKFTLSRHNESASDNCGKTQVYVEGDLETAARIGSTLDKDCKFLVENKTRPCSDREVLRLRD